MKPLLVVLLAALTIAATAGPATAQEEDRGSVEVGYQVGPFNGSAGDWPIQVVEVSGQLTEGDDVTVALTGDAGTIWTATVPFRSPVTRVEVDEFVAVGDLTGVTISQAFEVITVIEIPDGIDEPVPQEDVDATVDDRPPPTALPNDAERGIPPLDSDADVADPGIEVLGGGSGRDSGQLALSVIVSLVVLVLVFRTPLPAASTQRWRS